VVGRRGRGKDTVDASIDEDSDQGRPHLPVLDLLPPLGAAAGSQRHRSDARPRADIGSLFLVSPKRAWAIARWTSDAPTAKSFRHAKCVLYGSLFLQELTMLARLIRRIDHDDLVLLVYNVVLMLSTLAMAVALVLQCT
jgi:hypothetical protein